MRWDVDLETWLVWEFMALGGYHTLLLSRPLAERPLGGLYGPVEGCIHSLIAPSTAKHTLRLSSCTCESL